MQSSMALLAHSAEGKRSRFIAAALNMGCRADVHVLEVDHVAKARFIGFD